MKKKNIGSALALYPTPVVVVGTYVDGQPNWLTAAHVGIMGLDRVMVSLHEVHHTNKGIRATGKLSLAIVDQNLLARCDHVGTVSGAKTDKSGVFAHFRGEAGTPVIEDSPLVMECEVVDTYKTPGFENFVCTIANTYVDENCLTEQNKVDYDKLKPVLFEMPTNSYLICGEHLGKCGSFAKQAGQEG